MRRALVFAFLLVACGPGIKGGPTMNNHVNDRNTAYDDAPKIQSNDILARDQVTKQSRVQHILISGKDLAANFGGQQSERAAARTREEADALAVKVLERVRSGEAMEPLMKEFSDDQGSADSGEPYDVTPEAQLVFEFKRMGLRLQVGEAGLVLTQFGWHVIKRLE